MTLSRRSLITGLVSFVAAPAIVRATSIMPVKPQDGWHRVYLGYLDRFRSSSLTLDGTGDYISVPDDFRIDANSFTIDYWYKRTPNGILILPI